MWGLQGLRKSGETEAMSTIYKVSVNDPKTGKPAVRWGGSMAQVREHKAELTEATGCKPRDPKVEELEIGYNKADTISFLNVHATGA